MKPVMYPQTSHSCKQFIARVTLEFLDPDMRPLMCSERTLHSERSETLYTFIRLLVGVDANVANKIGRFLEFLGAVLTLMPSDAVCL